MYTNISKLKHYHIIVLFLFSVFASVFVYNQVHRESEISNQNTTNNKSSQTCMSDEFLQNMEQSYNEFQKGIVNAARERTTHEVKYIDKSYSTNNGKPPDHEGVCTDHFWRALEGVDLDFQEILYTDMTLNTSDYPLQIWNMSEPNKYIDFRRVPNIEAYLEKYAAKETTEITKCDPENLSKWQPGDILIFKLRGPGTLSDHIAIVSDKRDENGIPYLFHNYGAGEVERPSQSWLSKVSGHYRITQNMFTNGN